MSQSWSAGTAYPGTVTTSDWVVGNPRGQCGVSSAWLAEVLNHEYSIRSTFCIGSVIFVDRQAENILHHCWLELNGESGEEFVLDVTCDQARGFNEEVVFDSKAALEQQHVQYIAEKRVDISDLPDNPVWLRYQGLLLNMAILMVGALGDWLQLIATLRDNASAPMNRAARGDAGAD